MMWIQKLNSDHEMPNITICNHLTLATSVDMSSRSGDFCYLRNSTALHLLQRVERRGRLEKVGCVNKNRL
jgi:hypothetical protein